MQLRHLGYQITLPGNKQTYIQFHPRNSNWIENVAPLKKNVETSTISIWIAHIVHSPAAVRVIALLDFQNLPPTLGLM